MSTGMVGADYESGEAMTGVALAWSAGDGSYATENSRGDLESKLASIHPYLRYAVSESISLWGVAGLGEGKLTLEANDGERSEADLSFTMAAVGIRGALLSEAGFDLAWKGDGVFVRTESEAAGGFDAADARTMRFRLTLEGSRSFETASGVLTPSLEAGLRFDAGDAETGHGVEFGGGLHWRGSRLAAQIRARGLLAHNEGDYGEWGVSASVSYGTGPGGRGLSMKLGSAWGAASGGIERLWSQGARAGLARSGDFEPGAAGFDAEVGYGVGAMGGLLTPYTGLSVSGAGKTFRAGGRFRLGESLTMSLEGDLREKENGDEPVHGVKLEGSLRW